MLPVYAFLPIFVAILSSIFQVSPMVGWFRGDTLGNAATLEATSAVPGSQANRNRPTETGILRGRARIGEGMVGTGFALGGGADAFLLPSAFRIPSQNFTIEAWIRRSNPDITALDGMAGKALANRRNGLAFGLTHAGQLYLRQIGSEPVLSTTAIRDLDWHHVACVRNNGEVRFFLDGVLVTTAVCMHQFDLAGPYAIGGLGIPLVSESGTAQWFGFLGNIDELSVYDGPVDASVIRAIHAARSAGKSLVPEGRRKRPPTAPARSIPGRP